MILHANLLSSCLLMAHMLHKQCILLRHKILVVVSQLVENNKVELTGQSLCLYCTEVSLFTSSAFRDLPSGWPHR